MKQWIDILQDQPFLKNLNFKQKKGKEVQKKIGIEVVEFFMLIKMIFIIILIKRVLEKMKIIPGFLRKR